MASIPKDKLPDSTISVLKEGYDFIPNRAKKYQTDLFKIRLMGKEMVCITGTEAAEIFYSPRFKRKNALPKRIQTTLMGKHGVHSLDGDAHHYRKQMFMSLMDEKSLKRFNRICREHWNIFTKKWEKVSSFILFDEIQELMTRAGCEWASVPLNEWEVKKRANNLGEMIEAFGGAGLRNFIGKQARKQSESWIADIIDQVRNGLIEPIPGSPLEVIANQRDINGDLLDRSVAAVEVLNIIRPIVAIAYYITFSALALHQYPETREKIKKEDASYTEWFIHEVRRYYPFAPFLGAIVAEDFDWKGYHFKPGKMVLLDVYGINHDPRIWDNPDEFQPERFKDWQGNPFNFVPQGGGDHYKGHRCAGEWITIEAMKVATDFLANRIEYKVLDQDLHYSLSRMPAKPASGMMIRDVQVIDQAGTANVKEKVDKEKKA